MLNKFLKIILLFVCVPFVAGCQQSEPKELMITSQPVAEQYISFPEGFTLEVGVNNEKLVKSYQWQIDNGKDIDPQWVSLDCVSGRTNTLVKMATESNTRDKRYRCIITDINDKQIITNDAYVKLNNAYQPMDLICFAGYAIKAGETFDLSKTNLGSGIIEYKQNGYEVNLYDIKFDNSNPIYDYYDTSVGFDVLSYDCPHKEFIINVNGVNNLTNTYWQEESNSGGIIFCFNFMNDSQVEKVVFQGNGSLSMAGGTHLIYANTDVEINCDMIFNKIGNRYATGVFAYDIIVKENVNIDANLNGFLFQTKSNDEGEYGDITIENGSTINVISTVPQVSVGSTDFHLISAMNSLTIEGSQLNFVVNGDKDRFDPGQGAAELVGLRAHHGDIKIKNSKINGRYTTNNPSQVIFLNQRLIVAEDKGLIIEGSSIDCFVDDNKISNGGGIYAHDDISIKTSNIRIESLTSGVVQGISSNGDISLDESDVTVKYHTYTTNAISRGVICCGLTLTNNSTLDISSDRGEAISVQVGSGQEEKGYDENYVPSILNKMNVVSPTNYLINQYSIAGSLHSYAYMETIYIASEKTSPYHSCILSK